MEAVVCRVLAMACHALVPLVLAADRAAAAALAASAVLQGTETVWVAWHPREMD